MNEALESLLIIYLKLQVYGGLFGIVFFIVGMIISAVIEFRKRRKG